jgi:A/G-specific adenine glycosylase
MTTDRRATPEIGSPVLTPPTAADLTPGPETTTSITSHAKTPLPMKPNALDQPAAFQRALTAWFDREGRDFPWRRTTDPYAVLVSEMMLQQTTLAMVLERGHYVRWMEAFPDVVTLAAAPEAAVLARWEGLGYYNRARHLQQAARTVLERHDGVFPESLPEILALPGVGRYTAGAVYSFAFDRPAPLVDGNVARVLARLMDFHTEIDTPAGQKQLWSWAEDLLPSRRVRSYNSALMELGQRLCVSGPPSCLLCPVNTWCQAAAPAALPRKKPRRATVEVEEDVLVARHAGAILLQQEQGRRRRGLWKLPAVHGRRCGALLWQGRYTITHHRVSLRLHAAAGRPAARADEAWVREEELAALPMPSPFRRALNTVLAPPAPPGGARPPDGPAVQTPAAGPPPPSSNDTP